MSFLDFLNGVNVGGSIDVKGGFAIGLGVLGAACFLTVFTPQTYNTYKTKNTVGMNRLMFFLHLMVGLLFFWGAFFLAVSALFDGSNGLGKMVNACIFMVLNSISFSCCLYTVVLRDKNVEEAKRMGLSELEHYQQCCLPRVQAREVERS